MVTRKVWQAANVALGILSLLLFLSLLGVHLPTVGRAQYWLTGGEPFCAVHWGQETTPLRDTDRCCFEASQQLSCQRQAGSVDAHATQWVCQTGAGEVLQYLLNTKAYGYCHLQPYWGR